jgi:hypothetical protein
LASKSAAAATTTRPQPRHANANAHPRTIHDPATFGPEPLRGAPAGDAVREAGVPDGSGAAGAGGGGGRVGAVVERGGVRWRARECVWGHGHGVGAGCHVWRSAVCVCADRVWGREWTEGGGLGIVEECLWGDDGGTDVKSGGPAGCEGAHDEWACECWEDEEADPAVELEGGEWCWGVIFSNFLFSLYSLTLHSLCVTSRRFNYCFCVILFFIVALLTVVHLYNSRNVFFFFLLHGI